MQILFTKAISHVRPSPPVYNCSTGSISRHTTFAGVALVLFAVFGQAQEPATNVRGGRGARGETAAISGAKEDPAAVERGAKLYAANCAGCHGNTARGNPGAPDLIRSIVVLTDE